MICCKFCCLSNVKFIDGEENCPHWSDDIKNWPEIWPDWYGRASNRSKLPTNSCTDLCQSLFTANINWPVWGCVKPGDKLLHGSVSIAFQCKHYSVRLRLCQTAKRFILITFNVWGCVKPNDKLSNRFVSTTFQCTHIWSLVSPFADISNPVTKQRTDLCWSLFNANINWFSNAFTFRILPYLVRFLKYQEFSNRFVLITFQCKHQLVCLRMCQT